MVSVQCILRNVIVKFILDTHNRWHPIARLLGRGMGYLLAIQIGSVFLLYHLQTVLYGAMLYVPGIGICSVCHWISDRTGTWPWCKSLDIRPIGRRHMVTWLSWPCFHTSLHNFPQMSAQRGAITHRWIQLQHQMHFYATLLIPFLEIWFNFKINLHIQWNF